MDFDVKDVGDDYGTLELTPGQDDSFSVHGYAQRGQVTIAVPLYAHEARALIEALTPIAQLSSVT